MKIKCLLMALALIWLSTSLNEDRALARVKLVALPERGDVTVRLDNPEATLIEEERVLTLQKGINRVDFSWKGVSIDEDSIRLRILSHPNEARLLAVSYPPDEKALVWEISALDALEVRARISYLLSNIDRLITYKGIANRQETLIDLKAFVVVRNFSGEDFETARFFVQEGRSFDSGIMRDETRQILFMERKGLPIKKNWTFDSRNTPWEPEKSESNIGIPVSYILKNDLDENGRQINLPQGKARLFQEDGSGNVIFLGEDKNPSVPGGEEMDLYIGDSRDLVINQTKMSERWINVRRNKKGKVVLFDTDEMIRARVENFKDNPATLTMIQRIQGQWDMEECNISYKKRDAYTLEFRILLPPKGKKELTMHYHRRNLRP